MARLNCYKLFSFVASIPHFPAVCKNNKKAVKKSRVCLKNHSAQTSSCRGTQPQGPGKDLSDHRRDPVRVDQKDHQTSCHIQNSHGRNQPLGHMGQTFQTTQDYGENQRRQQLSGHLLGIIILPWLQHLDQKKAITRYAAPLVQEGQVIALERV